ncbi:ubiquinol-cytochrome c reductase [Alteromonas halophila]|uniref:Ubiquinol-cytochrome c reductase n=2 Tax=Alteromonas halophila TaxID=516698 RepID=A0A918JPL6_9ALTE|nr:ubiquinol-cytochrome c reductase [Alteromonas halophila]
MAGRIAGSMLTNGASEWFKGKRPGLSDLLLTPANITRITDQLATMRGAAMKVGQIISMDSGEFLPKELGQILARLREDAEPMPEAQLIEVLEASWGKQWRDRLLYFSFAPIASASIGQVHKAITPEGRMMAVKVQYPGVKDSIDSDVDNVATLIRMSGLIPKAVPIAPLLEEAKAQLHLEADYLHEAAMLKRYRDAVGEDPRFIIPEVIPAFSSGDVLAMDFVESQPLESVLEQPQEQRDAYMTSLMELFFRELFEFHTLQSDPNLANYRVINASQQLVLLDFGATRSIPPAIAGHYQQLLNAAACNDHGMMREAALAIGLISEYHNDAQQQAVIELGMMACESIRADGAYDFGTTDLLTRTHDAGMTLTYDLQFWHAPPADALFIHRKLGGLFLMAKRLEARVDMRHVAAPWLDHG